MSRNNGNNLSSTTSASSVSGKGLPSVWARAFTAKSSWPDKDEFLDVVYWLRQLVGVILGLIWGTAALQGAFGLVSFAVLNAAVFYVYIAAFQGVDEEEYGGLWELTKEGFLTSSASFLVIWIILYTGLHYEQ